MGYIQIASGFTLLLVSYKIGSISSLFLFMQVAGAVCFFVLLIYSVFIEIGLQSPYNGCKERMAIDKGTYGLVRHPGFIWFLLLILILISLYRNIQFALFALCITFMNFVLILIEDLFLFPKLFVNYEDYKRKVPFIIPRLSSINKMLGSVQDESD
jgi:protein-S-isoprenylcysteine O-methyltransferase Ste14